jgi:acetyl-CoA synthetase
VLQQLGIKPGDVVTTYLPRSPKLISSFFGILKLQSLSCILFSTLGEEALLDRLENSKAKIVITKKSLARKILSIQEKLADLKAILIVDMDEHQSEFVLSLKKLMCDAEKLFEYPIFLDSETPAFLQYTSGSTGKPKGALHVHGAIASMEQSFHEIMKIQNNDVYWCTADPAWITGLVYGIIVPFCTKTRQVQFNGVYHAESWLKILEKQKVNIWYTAPTALRMLMQENETTFDQYNYSSLKRIYSVGEPLNPEIYAWGKKIFHTEIYDTWFQSETGSIMIANRPGLAIKPGSMGVPISDIEVMICNDQMESVPTGTQGNLCLRKGWHSMFRSYFRKEEVYAEKFQGDIYITGDLARKDEDGYVWYISRSDDVINSAGHLIGPFEVESVLLEIEEIVDVAVIGVDDPILYQKIIAFVKLRKDDRWSRELELKCRIHVSNKVSTVAIPAEFRIIDRIPKNQSGKILRRVLKAVYEGKDPGDLSTME